MSDDSSPERRILLVSHELSMTGAPNSLLRQARYFLDAGYRVDVWSFAGGELGPYYAECGLKPEIVPNDRQAIRRKYEADPVRYELVVCNTIRTWRAVDALRRYRMKVVWFVRETRLLDEDFWFEVGFAKLFRRFYNLYTVSDYAASVVRRYNPRVRVIRNSVADCFRGFTPPSSRIRFGYIGSLIAVKGIGLLLAAFRRVRERFPDAELTVAGGVPEPTFARLKAETAGDASVRWLGVVHGAAKREFFDSIDVLCVPSMDEPSGLTVIEGAACGKAIVTTDRTGANYLVDGSNGRIVAAGSETELADAMAELAAASPDGLRRRCERSRALYLELGTPERERAAVLAMVADSPRSPRVWSRLGSDERRPWFREVRNNSGHRLFYFRETKVLSLRGPGVVRS